MKTHTQEIFVVKQVATTKEWFWQARNAKNGQILGNSADFHKKRAYTIRKAQEMALGRPVYLVKIDLPKGIAKQVLISGAPIALTPLLGLALVAK